MLSALLMLYLEVNVFCVLILALILYKIERGIDRQNNQRLFTRVLLCNMILIIVDIVWIFIDSMYLQISPITNFVLNEFNYILTGVNSYLWFFYSESMLGSVITKNTRFKILSIIPLLILSLMAVCSFQTDWLFHIDSNNHYIPGNLRYLRPIVIYGYIIFAAIHALITALRKDSYLYRTKYFALVSFALWPIILGMLQITNPDLPLECVGITLSLLWVFIHLQEQLISLDPLTELNNRKELMKLLAVKLKHYDASRKLFLLVIDIDHFKKINDQYGHVEGDAALVRIAESLKLGSKDYPSFISRFGGDEFIIIHEVDQSEDIDLLCDSIHEAVSVANKLADTPYRLCLSIGYVEYNENIRSIEDFIHMADKEMYRMKAAKKKHLPKST